VLNKATECYGKIDLATKLSVLQTLWSTLHISKFFLMYVGCNRDKAQNKRKQRPDIAAIPECKQLYCREHYE
jgi:hypothetical protein